MPFSEQELLVSPFEPIGTVMGKNLKDVEHVGGIVYTADSETLYTDLFSALTEIPLEPTYQRKPLLGQRFPSEPLQKSCSLVCF